jgi:hypothetical protein
MAAILTECEDAGIYRFTRCQVQVGNQLKSANQRVAFRINGPPAGTSLLGSAVETGSAIT